MESVNQRVFRLLGSEHGVQKRLAEHLGISDRNVNMWKERGSAINSEFIPRIADFLRVTDTYLLRGEESEGEVFAREEIKLIDGYRKLDPNVRRFVFESLTASEQINEAKKKANEYIENYKKQAPSTQSGLARELVE